MYILIVVLCAVLPILMAVSMIFAAHRRKAKP